MADGSPAVVAEKVTRVLDLHEQRVLAYKRWEKAFKAYVALEDQADGWEDYQNSIKEATTEFAKISTAMRETEAQIAELRPDLAAMVRALQELEKQKLQLTVKLQAGKEKAVFVDEETDWVWEREEQNMKQQLMKLIEEINLIIDSFRFELHDLS